MYEPDFYAPNFDEGEYIEKEKDKEKGKLNSQKVIIDIKRNDSHFYRIHYANNIWMNEQFYKQLFIECYSSGNTGAYIRDAVTGDLTRYIVGSQDEDLFFKMRDATGTMSSRGDSGSFFYMSPEQCENNRYCEIDKSVKDAWNIKYTEAVKRIQLDDEKASAKTQPTIIHN